MSETLPADVSSAKPSADSRHKNKRPLRSPQAMAYQRSSQRPLSRPRGRAALAALLLLAAAAGPALAQTYQQTYQKPPQAVLDVLNAPVPPQGTISPARDYMLLVQGVRYP